MSDALAILIAERDRLTAERDRLTTERDRLDVERDRLDTEGDRLDQAIAILKGEAPPRRGPGRPPGSKNKEAKKRGRKPMDDASRKAVSERMKQYWADRRKAQEAQE